MVFKEGKTVVCVVGLGTVGLPTAVHVSNFSEIFGYDIKREAVEKAISKGFRATNIWLKVPKAEIYVITVNTEIDKYGKPDVSSVRDVFSKISKNNPSALICVESTVPVGTCRELSEIFNLESVVHCPHRYWAGDPVNHGVVQSRVLGALNESSMRMGKSFYEKIRIPFFTVSTIEVAEMSKIVENSYRFVHIAFAEDLSLLCAKLGIPFDEVRAACNSKWNIEILEARDGIKGHCLPKDIRYLLKISGSPLLHGAIKADKQYVKYIGDKRE